MSTQLRVRPDLAANRPTRQGAALVLLEDARVLLLRRSREEAVYPNCWDLPWAEVEAGGSPEDAVLALARGEWGIEVTSFSLLTAVDDVVDGTCWRRFVYRVHGFRGAAPAGEASRRWYSEKEFADVFQLNPLVGAVPLFG